MMIKRRVSSKVLCIILSLILVGTTAFTSVNVVSAANKITGTYTYSNREGSNKQGKDQFVYDDSYFESTAYNVDPHLVTLSAQAAMASGSRYGDAEDKYEQDTSNTGQNCRDFLTGLGFNNVESNGWSYHEMLENSIGVSVGQKKIVDGGSEYTLLAIIPRSAGYRQEFAGNMNVGTDAVHKGFFEARDEILRFVKQYINNNKINGKLKVWIAGHSRGGAVSNALGGFFAGGGIGYFGDGVSIEPKDVYCYTFATPRTIKSGASKNLALSVAGARGGDYANDTPGVAYNYTAGGTIVPNDTTFNCIHNYPFAYDVVPYLPFANWGYTYYGNVCTYDGATDADMKKALNELDSKLYNDYINKGQASDFHEKTFNMSTLQIEDTKSGLSGKSGMETFISDRMNVEFKNFSTTDKYVNSGYQEAMMGAMASVLLLMDMSDDLKTVEANMTQPLLFSYLAYASSELISEGKASNEDEASAIAFEQIIEYATGKNIDVNNYTVDEFIKTLGEFVRDNEGKEAAKKVSEYVTKAVPKEYVSTAQNSLGAFYRGSKQEGYDPTKVPIGDIVMDFLKACANGADPSTKAYETEQWRDGKGVRKTLYTLTSLMAFFNNDMKKINNAINDGNGQFKDFVAAMLYLMKRYNPEGGGTAQYATLGDAADGEFVKAINKIEKEIYSVMATKGLYNEEYKKMVEKQLGVVKSHIKQIRCGVMDIMFEHNGNFNTTYNIRNASTMYGNAERMLITHYPELCNAYGKAMPIRTEGISVAPQSQDMAVGDTLTLTVTITPDDASSDVTYTSSKSEVATVDNAGKVTAVSEGETTITVKTADGKHSAESKIIVKKLDPNLIAPQANDRMTYIGAPLPLVESGYADGGTFYYGLGNEKTEPTEWSTSVPEATDVGTYYVWYKFDGGGRYNDVKPTYVGAASTIVKTSDNVIDVNIMTETATVKDDVMGASSTVALDVILEAPVCRMYDPSRGEHFYTKSIAEAQMLESLGWVHEEESDFIVVDASDEDAIPVYRMYNPNGGGMHFYTEDANEAKALINVGWDYEGISHYVYKKTHGKGLAQYRLYNPNSPNGEHNWTTSVDEWDMLKNLGWIDEDIRWKIED